MIAFGADGQSMRQGEDEALFWCWWCVENAFREGEFIVEEILFTLIEVRENYVLDMAETRETDFEGRENSY